MTNAAPTTDDPALFRLFNEIGIIHQLATTRLERALPEPLTRAQFLMLNHLVRLGGPRSPQELARSFQVTKGAVTHTMGKLSEQRLIEVWPDPSDGRGKLVDLTEAGRRARAECVAALLEAFSDIAEGFPADAVAVALEPLTALRRQLDAAR